MASDCGLQLLHLILLSLSPGQSVGINPGRWDSSLTTERSGSSVEGDIDLT